MRTLKNMNTKTGLEGAYLLRIIFYSIANNFFSIVDKLKIQTDLETAIFWSSAHEDLSEKKDTII